jgi:hypothetical protein
LSRQGSDVEIPLGWCLIHDGQNDESGKIARVKFCGNAMLCRQVPPPVKRALQRRD